MSNHSEEKITKCGKCGRYHHWSVTCAFAEVFMKDSIKDGFKEHFNEGQTSRAVDC